MSGGVDSSVVAALAARTGAEVIGVTLQLYDHGEAVKRSGSCCAGQDIYDAKTVCDRLGIAHYVLDYESRFRTGVIDRFADEYAQGRTPVPCSLCNQGVKFVDLIACERDCRNCSYAAALDCDGNCGVCPHNSYCPCVNPVVARSKTALRLIELRPILLQEAQVRA